MVDLKKYNYFTGNISCVARGVSDIVKFWDLAGRNYLLFSPPKPSSSSKYHDLCLYHYLENKIEFNNYDDFFQKISDNSNLFRVDLLVFDFWSIHKNQQWKYIKLIEGLSVDSVIVSREYEYATSDNVNDFHLRTEYKDLNKSEIWLHDKIKNTTSNLEFLKRSWIRDKKLEYLFDNEKKQ